MPEGEERPGWRVCILFVAGLGTGRRVRGRSGDDGAGAGGCDVWRGGAEVCVAGQGEHFRDAQAVVWFTDVGERLFLDGFGIGFFDGFRLFLDDNGLGRTRGEGECDGEEGGGFG